MTRVVVTGSSGKLGRAVVEELAAHGFELVTVDQAPPPPGQPGAFTRADLTDLGQVIELFTGIDDRFEGVDAVVHLAAIPAPGQRPNGAIFHNNVPATFNVFQAARLAGLTKVVWASSETLLGLPLEVPPPYAPLDEEVVMPNTTYSLGKAVEEEMARHFARWNPELSILGLRFSNVMAPEDYAEFPSWQDDPARRRWNLWGYIDARDGAQAVRRALEVELPGAHNFVIANADTVMTRPSVELMAEVFPDVPLRTQVEGTGTLLSIEKARRLLGYEPQHSWRTELGD
jgi:nucleoside-diphosphate-sugar epimerase